MKWPNHPKIIFFLFGSQELLLQRYEKIVFIISRPPSQSLRVPGTAKFGAPTPRPAGGAGGAKPPKMGFCSGGTRGAKKCEKRAFLGQKRAKNDDF
jgi:hypothetical protein